MKRLAVTVTAALGITLAVADPMTPNYGAVGPDKYGNYYQYHKISEVGPIVGISLSPTSESPSYSLDCQHEIFNSVESSEWKKISSDKLASELYVKVCVREGLVQSAPPAHCTAHNSVVVNFNPATGIADFNVDKNDCVRGPYQYVGKSRVVGIQGDMIGIGGANLALPWGMGAYYYIDCAHATLTNANSLGEQVVGRELYFKLCKDGHISYVPPYAPH
jgi:hypothetical protein